MPGRRTGRPVRFPRITYLIGPRLTAKSHEKGKIRPANFFFAACDCNCQDSRSYLMARSRRPLSGEAKTIRLSYKQSITTWLYFTANSISC